VSVKKREEGLEELRNKERIWEGKWEEIKEGFIRLEKEMCERIDKRIEERIRI